MALKGPFKTNERVHTMPQSLAKVYLHVVFSTKNREPVLADDWLDELFRVLGGTANNLGCQSLIVGGTSDHVHMLFQLDAPSRLPMPPAKSNPRRPCGSTRRVGQKRRFIGKR